MRSFIVVCTAILILGTAAAADAQYAAWWHFDENAGDTAADASGNGNTGRLGTAVGVDPADPEWTTGRFNAGLNFSGAQLVQAPDSASLDVTGSLTVEAWVNLSSVAAQFTPIISKWDDIGDNQRGYLIVVLPDRRVRFDVSHNGLFGCGAVLGGPFAIACATNAVVVSAAQVPIGQWTHIVGRFDSTTRQVSVFINGVLSNQVVAVGSSIFNSSAPAFIGATDAGSDARDFFRGKIDEPRIWNVALTDAYINKLYKLQTLSLTKSIVGADDIPISAGSSTARQFEIAITNTSGATVDLTGFSFQDVVPAEFDLNGALVVAGSCSPTASQPPGATKGQQPKLEPELLALGLATSLANGQACTIDVFVTTDENPASSKGNKATQFEPTSCPAGGVQLNEGIQVYDTATFGAPLLVLGPISPLYLSCEQ
jgi:hypothetical protein